MFPNIFTCYSVFLTFFRCISVCLSVDVLYNSPAGAMLSFIIHSLLLLPVYIIRPLLHELLSLLPLLDKLNRMLPAAALLEEQEWEWSIQGAVTDMAYKHHLLHRAANASDFIINLPIL